MTRPYTPAAIYHGTPLTPRAALQSMAGRAFCVSFYRPDDIQHVAQLASSVMLDNGAFSFWKKARKQGKEACEAERDWRPYYAWAEQWLDGPNRWAVVPDAIAMPSQINDALLNDCPLPRHLSAPVYHMDEPIGRLGRLLEQGWNRVCLGWVGEYDPTTNDIRKEQKQVGCKAYLRRLDEIDAEIPGLPWENTHMMRGIAVNRLRPFQERRRHKFSPKWPSARLARCGNALDASAEMARAQLVCRQVGRKTL